MAASVNLARFYLQDTRALPMNIWVMDGEVPYPEWSDADMVFVLNPPPLDIPLLAEVWKEGRTLILVSTKLDSGLMEAGLHPLKELLALPNNATAEVLMHLKQRQASVFFLSFQRRRPWYTNWLPQLERDSFLVDGARFVFLALSGTLCQLKTSAARYHADRVRLLDAKEDGLRAVQYARPADKSRDMNYWMHAVLTDWVLFPDQVQGDPTRADAEYARMVQYLSDHLPQASENHYDLMMAYLAASVEAVCRHDMQIRDLIGAHAGGPAWLTSLFERADYDGRKDGSYALCLAAGYAALLCPSMGWSVNSLAIPMAEAQHFFFDRPDWHGSRAGVILRVVALTSAACRLFYLHIRDEAAVFCLLRRFDRWIQRRSASKVRQGLLLFFLALTNFVSSTTAVLLFKSLWASGKADFLTQQDDRALAAGILSLCMSGVLLVYFYTGTGWMMSSWWLFFTDHVSKSNVELIPRWPVGFYLYGLLSFMHGFWLIFGRSRAFDRMV